MALPSLARVPAPPDSILGLAEAARADTRAGKINLSSGVFVDETGTTPVLPSVTEAERRILAAGRTKLYRPIDGEAAFRDAVRDLVFTPDHEVVRSGRVAVSQTPGGTGGLRVAADFLRQTGGGATIWMSQPTWPNHPQLFLAAGFRIREYPYTDPSGRRIDEAGPARGARRGVAGRRGPVARLVPQPDRASTRRPGCGGRSATWSRTGGSCRSSTSPTRASATGSARTPTGWTGCSGRGSSCSSRPRTRRASPSTTSGSAPSSSSRAPPPRPRPPSRT